jgi:beta-lactam-binding protein with PASTA domain
LVYVFPTAGEQGEHRVQAVDDPDSKKKRKRLIRVLIVVAVIVFIFIPAVALTGLWITERQKQAGRPQQVTVPNVVGQDYRKGESILEEKGLKMRVLATRWDQNQPVGVIIDQSPLAGESVEVGRSVGVSVGGKPGQQFGQPVR